MLEFIVPCAIIYRAVYRLLLEVVKSGKYLLWLSAYWLMINS